LERDNYHGDLYLFWFTLADIQELFEKIRIESVAIFDGNVVGHFFELGGLWLDSITPQLVYYRLKFSGGDMRLGDFGSVLDLSQEEVNEDPQIIARGEYKR
jgi:hypothetical protein